MLDLKRLAEAEAMLARFSRENEWLALQVCLHLAPCRYFKMYVGQMNENAGLSPRRAAKCQFVEPRWI